MKRSRLHAVSGPHAADSRAFDSDEALVALARTGDRDAFAELWHRHARSGLRVARQFTSSIDADDLVAEAYTRIYGRVLAGGGPVGAFRPYLYTTIRNIASRWGQATHEVPVGDIGEFEDPAADGDPFTSTLDRTLTVDAFRTLPERWQSVLWYTEIEGLDPQEVAPLLGISANGVAALSYRAREGLRKAWLQAHVSDTTASGECRWTLSRLGDYTRQGLSARDHDRVDVHLQMCAKCTLLSQEVDEVGSQLAMTLLPILFGATVGGTLLASFSAPGSATAAHLVVAPALPAALHGAAHGALAAGASAASAASVVGTLTLALVVSGGLAVGINRDAGPTPQHSTSAQPVSTAAHPDETPVAAPEQMSPGQASGSVDAVESAPRTAGASARGTIVDVVGVATGTVGGTVDVAGSLVHSIASPLNTVIPVLPLLSDPASAPGDAVGGAVVPLISKTLQSTVDLLK